jgi:mannose-6-phosphate isomerase
METLYPLKFSPIPREMLWGGDSLRKLFNKPFPDTARIGESWEISAVQDNVSVVSNGLLRGNNLLELAEVYMGELLGEKVFDLYGIEFPLLVKLIDARDDLSIQVHPDDELAKLRHTARGKTEMWYVLEAVPGAQLISGFNRDVSPAILKEKLTNGKILDILNVEKVKAGDAFFMPAGRVHAIGRGIMLAEIQQTSDITYRLYDWDRVDDAGNSRELHIDLALDAIDFNHYPDYRTVPEKEMDGSKLLADCSYFTTRLIRSGSRLIRDYSLLDSFVILICTAGNFIIESKSDPVHVAKGDTVLIPAITEEITLSCSPHTELLEVYIKS